MLHTALMSSTNMSRGSDSCPLIVANGENTGGANRLEPALSTLDEKLIINTATSWSSLAPASQHKLLLKTTSGSESLKSSCRKRLDFMHQEHRESPINGPSASINFSSNHLSVGAASRGRGRQPKRMAIVTGTIKTTTAKMMAPQLTSSSSCMPPQPNTKRNARERKRVKTSNLKMI